MSEHVSIETAKALAEAGLRREWAIGDWVAFQRGNGKWDRGLIDEVGEPYAVGCEGNRVARLVHLCIWRRMTSDRLRAEGMRTTDTHLLWLPTIGQLLGLLAARGRPSVHKTSTVWLAGLVEHDLLPRRGEHADLAEACGQALLAALRAKGEGK